MREIKFRGINNGGNWCFGDLIQSNNDHNVWIHAPKINHTYKVDPATVGQFTGMYDAEGSEIYEGDVLNNLYGHLSVSYKQEWAAFVVCGVDKTGYYHEYLLDKIVNTPVRRSEIKVIGNVHDNPDLLEVEHD